MTRAMGRDCFGQQITHYCRPTLTEAAALCLAHRAAAELIHVGGLVPRMVMTRLLLEPLQMLGRTPRWLHWLQEAFLLEPLQKRERSVAYLEEQPRTQELIKREMSEGWWYLARLASL